MPKLTVPISEKDIRALYVGDTVYLNGVIVLGRDAAHKFMIENFIRNPVPAEEAELYSELKKLLDGGVIYHCGPVVKKHDDGSWSFVAAGPTTSIREEPYQGEVIRRYGVRAVIGKGGMGAKTLAALKEHGAVYLNAIGGAAQFYARTIERVSGVSLLEFGTPEAMWHFEASDFPAIVTMDAHGNSLHQVVEEESARALAGVQK